MRESKEVVYAKLPPFLPNGKIIGVDIDFDAIHYPRYVSTKLNGVRCVILGGVPHSRTMREFSLCPEVEKRLEPTMAYAREKQLVLDGELYSPSHATVGEVRSILAGNLPMPDDFGYYCFFQMKREQWHSLTPVPLREMITKLVPTFLVNQMIVESPEDFKRLIRENRDRGIEGFVSFAQFTCYKNGRSTVSEEFLKFKYYGDEIDAKVVGITRRKSRLAGLEGKLHPTGYACPTYKQDDYEETDIGGALEVRTESGDLYTIPFPIGYTLQDRALALELFGTGKEGDLLGQWVCFKPLAAEAKNKPSGIKNVQFRDRKD